MAYMGVVPVEIMKKAVGAGHYHPGQIHRSNKYLYKKGTRVYLLDTPDGKTLVMQSWTPFVNKGETATNLKDLGKRVQGTATGLEVPDQGAQPRPDRRGAGTPAVGMGDAGRVPEHLPGGCGYDTGL